MAHQCMPKIFHGPHKNPPAHPPTYLMYGPLRKNVRVYYAPFITKDLVEAIMNRSRLISKINILRDHLAKDFGF